jgi:tripartite-type tricarboxylate transporter receptor subunit TctC
VQDVRNLPAWRTAATIAAAFAIAMLIGGSEAVAQSSYPERPIKVITNAAGSLPDIAARIILLEMEKRLGKPFVIENIGGAAGSVAAERAARAPADGYTLFITGDAALTTNVATMEKLNYDPVRDFAPISLLIDSVNILAVHPSFPAKSVAELVEAAKKEPGKLTFASTGIGTSQHLGGELLKKMAGIDISHVTYRALAQSIPDLLGGRITMQFGNISGFLSHVKEGRLRGLAVSSLTRAPQLPGVPTMDELGYKGFEATAWVGLSAPAGTPQPIVQRLEDLAIAALKQPDVRQKLLDVGFIILAKNGKDFGEQIKAEIVSKGRLIREATKPN